MTDFDVGVVGAGPAGAFAARELALRGRRVLLVDRARFPRSKVCGSTLNGRACASLAGAGLLDRVKAAGAVPLRDVAIRCGGREARLPLASSLALSRERFDLLLLEAARAAGAEVLTGTSASLEPGDPHALVLDGKARRSVRCVVAADGLGGRLLGGDANVAVDSRVGAGALVGTAGDGYPRGRLFLACGDAGYAGVVRLEDGRLDVAAALAPAAARGDVRGAVARILELAGLPPLDLAGARFHGTVALTRRPRRGGPPGTFAIGDAAGYVEPFTGEGIAWALESAARVVAPVEAMIDGNMVAARSWPALHARTIGRRQRTCRAVAWLLRRPALLALGVRAVDRVPALGAAIVARLDGRSAIVPGPA